MRRTFFGVLWFASVALLPACSDDPISPPPPPPTPEQEIQPLTTRNAVLNNIEYAYGHRGIGIFPIDELLDDDFTFYLSTRDVNGGLPAQWSRIDELSLTRALFESNTAPIGPVARSLRFFLEFNDDTEWVEIVPQSAPTETWYAATVFYSFTVEMEPDNTFISVPGAKAEFVVREVATSSGNRWRLVAWRDLGGTLVRARQARAETDETTWGAIKALYN